MSDVKTEEPKGEDSEGETEDEQKVEEKKECEQEKEEEKEEEGDGDDEEAILKNLNLGKNCIDILRNAFTAFDQEKKGVLGTEMIGVILELLGGNPLPPGELDEIIREVDADGSGELEFVEFITLASKFLPEDSDDEEDSPEQVRFQLKEAFRLYDTEGNGYITVDVFKSVLQELDPELTYDEVQGIVNEIDQDDSGTVDLDEFMNALQ